MCTASLYHPLFHALTSLHFHILSSTRPNLPQFHLFLHLPRVHYSSTFASSTLQSPLLPVFHLNLYFIRLTCLSNYFIHCRLFHPRNIIHLYQSSIPPRLFFTSSLLLPPLPLPDSCVQLVYFIHRCLLHPPSILHYCQLSTPLHSTPPRHYHPPSRDRWPPL